MNWTLDEVKKAFAPCGRGLITVTLNDKNYTKVCPSREGMFLFLLICNAIFFFRKIQHIILAKLKNNKEKEKKKMSYADLVFKNMCQDILKNGTDTRGEKVRPHWPDSTAAYTIKKFGICNRYDLRKEFPALTLRKTALKSAMDEILWIWQKKSNNIKDLNSHIWDSWADKDGSIGKAYGYQLGKLYPYKDVTLDGLKKAFPDGEYVNDEFAGIDMFVAKNGDDVIRWYAMKTDGMWNMDQVNKAIYDLRNTPFSRRIITSIYNFEDLTEMALYPCAYSMTFNVTQDKDSDKLVLNAILNQRSNDILAAGNWNVCQYALLVMMIAQVCDMIPGELVHMIADAHIYDRHVDIIKELLTREPLPAPVVRLNPDVKKFYDFTTDDLIVENYQTHPQIKNIPVAI